MRESRPPGSVRGAGGNSCPYRDQSSWRHPYAGHSLRSGFATTAARNGASEAAIMRQTGHRSLQVVRGYIQAGGLFNETAAAKLGL